MGKGLTDGVGELWICNLKGGCQTHYISPVPAKEVGHRCPKRGKPYKQMRRAGKVVRLDSRRYVYWNDGRKELYR